MQESSTESDDDTDFGYCPEYKALRDTTSALCSALPICDLIPQLISARVIDFDGRDELCEGSKSSHKITEYFIAKYVFISFFEAK